MGFGSAGLPRNEANVLAALLAEDDNAGVGVKLGVLDGNVLTTGAGVAAAGFEGAAKEKELVLTPAPPNPPNPPNFCAGAGTDDAYTQMSLTYDTAGMATPTSGVVAPDVLWLAETRFGNPRILVRRQNRSSAHNRDGMRTFVLQ